MAGTNFVWLTFDSIRGDRTSIGGHDRATTPTLESIGARPDGIATTCFSHAIWSQPSVASMMTGTYPSTHGSGSHNETLPGSIATVAERLSTAGYRTVGVSSNPYFSASTGTDRGFDKFDFVSGLDLAREAGLPAMASFVGNLRRFSGGFTLEKGKHSPDYLLNEIVKDRLRSATERGEPVFLAAHYYGAHHPYYPSPAFRSKFAADLPVSPSTAAQLAFDRTTNVYAEIARGRPEQGDHRDVIEAMYDAQVAQVDALVDELVTFLDRLGIGDETIVVVTADHGDLLGEMGLFSHKLLLHDALIEVPMAVRGSDVLPDVDLELAQHADIMQTILSELGADTTGMQGHQLDRTSRDVAVAQRGAETCRETIEEVRTYEPAFEHEHVLSGFVTALRTSDWKYASGDDGSVLYRLPHEDANVKAEYPDVVDRFETRLDEWMRDHGDLVDSTAAATFDEAARNRLADMGYLVE